MQRESKPVSTRLLFMIMSLLVIMSLVNGPSTLAEGMNPDPPIQNPDSSPPDSTVYVGDTTSGDVENPSLLELMLLIIETTIPIV